MYIYICIQYILFRICVTNNICNIDNNIYSLYHIYIYIYYKLYIQLGNPKIFFLGSVLIST